MQFSNGTLNATMHREARARRRLYYPQHAGWNLSTLYTKNESTVVLASSPGYSQILSRSRGVKSGEGLVPILRHGPEMVDSAS